MSASPTPGAGGAYRYDPITDDYVLLDVTEDELAPTHPLGEPEAPSAPASDSDSDSDSAFNFDPDAL